jgi:hypothetical protein
MPLAFGNHLTAILLHTRNIALSFVALKIFTFISWLGELSHLLDLKIIIDIPKADTTQTTVSISAYQDTRFNFDATASSLLPMSWQETTFSALLGYT